MNLLGKASVAVYRTLVLGGILLLCLNLSSGVHTATAAPSGKYFDHVVTIVMENRDLPSVLAHGPYQASLAKNYSLATGYSGVDHPSEPNYCVMIGATTTGCADDGTCCANTSNLVDRFESSGVTWKAFAEDADNSGTCNFSPPRGGDHFGFLLFNDNNGSPARCSNMLTTASPQDPEFIASLSDSANAPNFVWLTPNDHDNSHDTNIRTGDNYLAGIVPSILASPVFQNTRAALFIVYDEGNDVACATGGGQDCIYASWSGPGVTTGLNSTTSYDHYSYIHTIEDNWGLQPLNQKDAAAPVMSEFFTGGGTGTNLGTNQWLLIGAVVGGVGAVMLVSWKLLSRTSSSSRRHPRRTSHRKKPTVPPVPSP